MALEPGVVAGVSVTAVVAARSVLDRVRRSSEQKENAREIRGRMQTEQSLPAVRNVQSASQETPFVTGNMVLAINL